MKRIVLCVLMIGAQMALGGGKTQGTGIRQLIETRNGKLSCWGVIIEFEKLQLKSSLDSSELSIVDAKYGKDLKDIMTWIVRRDRTELLIEFKPDCGDFGTGNGVSVTINGSALEKPLPQSFVFAIPTDPL